ncbi:MAG TPA: mechanosensitive ion channel domain-containing protein [Blastocatellia bacterium]|nr:mechanosensitive ion channel domain-containing protein [Blastocatellia bacterium]
MLFQETAPPAPSLGDTIIERIIFFLNYPFVNQAEFKVSVLSLLLLILSIFIASMLSRYVTRFLEKRVLPRFNLDAGLRYTLLRVLHYLLVTAGLLYGLKLGFAIDLTGIAVILGFLSVGIGFGLQYIASDIVSGFILLFERPLRVGDRLKIDDVEGRVEQISLRSTRIVTNDEVNVIVPNSDLVRNKVINWSYCDRVRIRIPVGVAYGSDTQKVTDVLIEAARSVDTVLSEPAPKVHFKAFGDSSLDFELLVWINLPHNHPQIRSDLNYEIDRLFRENNIQIPFPQRDLHLRTGSIQIARDRRDEESLLVADD